MDHDRRAFLRSAAGIGAATIVTRLATSTPVDAQTIPSGLSELNLLTASDLASRIALRKGPQSRPSAPPWHVLRPLNVC
jgi:hypothetical protein